MALRNRAVNLNSVNQENVKTLKSSLNGIQSRRAALGEIGNKVVTTKNNDLTSKSKNILIKDKEKKKVPLEKEAQVLKNEKLEKNEKPELVVQQQLLLKEKVKTANHVETKKEMPVNQNVIKAKETTTEVLPVNTIKKETDSFSSDLITIEDIDEEDRKNPILVSIYSNDIYAHLRNLENQFPIEKGYLHGQEVTPKMRSVLVDWLIEVHEQFHLMQETLYLTIGIIDRFLQTYRQTTRRKLQLVGVTAMFIASKYEEMYSPDISDFVYITDNAYTKSEILQMELLMLKNLDFSFGRPLPLHFLRRYSKAGKALPIHHTLAKYFLEQCLVHYEVCHHPPSLIAAGAIYLSFLLVGNDNVEEGSNVIWTKTLAHYSTYTSQQVLPIVQEISSVVVAAEKSKYQAVRRKYSSSKHMKISLRQELKSPTLYSLANHRQE